MQSLYSERREQLFSFDQASMAPDQKGFVAGVDEAGRGPLAGPVVAAAVILFSHDGLNHLNDSKKVTPIRREELFLAIAKNALIGIGIVDEKRIDALNIYQATRVAMKQAVLNLNRSPDLVLVDGNMTLDLPIAQKAVVKGDQKSAAIAAASIVAKVHRDALMLALDERYPEYLFKKHKGYPTKEHLQRVYEFGPSPVHRRSFSPINRLSETGL